VIGVKRLSAEWRRQFCSRDVKTPSFMDKLVNGKRDQGDCDCVKKRDLLSKSNTLRECFNNVDVNVSS